MADRTLVIAEAGVNHNGSLDMARRLVDVAAEAGADVVKFQSFKADQLATRRAAKADYQVQNTREAGSQLDMLRALELGEAQHLELVQHCRQRGLRFMSTAFDAESLALLARLDMPAVKIPSGDLTCAPLLVQAARVGKPLIVSTGMSTLGEVEQALGVIAFALTTQGEPAGRADFEAAYASEAGRASLRERVTLLHCVTQYPAPPASIHLRAMDTLAAAFGLPVGYSDHTTGMEVALAAVARGASVIEKHFTLDRSLPGPDHAASLDPAELSQLVRAIRNVEDALGTPIKAPAQAELPNRSVARRSIVAARPIARGETLTLDALACRRPGTGLSPMDLWDVVGRPASRDFDLDDAIEP
jgi:N-acetylneuraminate synthase